MENDFDKQWEMIRSRAEECPLSDEELLRRVKMAVDTVAVKRWAWLPYTSAMATVALALTVMLHTGIVVLNNTGYNMTTHAIKPSTVVTANCEIMEAL
jgi:hypothetical protein